MGIRYERFEQMCDMYLDHPRGVSKEFMKEFSSLIRMAGYLADVDREAGKIYDEYCVLQECGLIRI